MKKVCDESRAMSGERQMYKSLYSNLKLNSLHIKLINL